jgi:hypothetical protein
MAYNILIAGAGQLGSRYLQGLSKFKDLLNIYVFDISDDSLNIAQSRWEECNNKIHQVHYIKEYNKLPEYLDVAIVSSSANVRVHIIKNILNLSEVKYWILEKFLAQNIEELEVIKKVTENSENVWVNTTMHTWPLYIELTKLYPQAKNVTANFLNIPGIICNSIHYIDFISRWINSDIKNIDLLGLKNSWIPSKRIGFYEAEGRLSIKFKDDSILNMTSKFGDENYSVEILVNNETWKVYENDGYAINTKGEILNGKILLQSDLTPIVLEQILMFGRSDLPILSQSISQHKPLLTSLKDHWNQFMNTEMDRLPIT